MTASSTFALFNGRLAQFKPWTNSQGDWDNVWRGHDVKSYLASASTGNLGEYEFLTRVLPKDRPVLEAGCGLGQFVAALRQRGYTVEGVDFAEATIRVVREHLPDLPVRVGDIYRLEVPDGFYGGYISLGVLEHNADGPAAALREAARVLGEGGVACISVPFLNAKRRRLRERLPAVPPTATTRDQFYQYYYSPEEFGSLLSAAGLTLKEAIPLSVEWGLIHDHPSVAWLHRHRFFHWRLRDRFTRWARNRSEAYRLRASHMMMYLCTKASPATRGS